MTETVWDLDDYDDSMTMRSNIERFFSRMPLWGRTAAIFEKAWKPLCDVYEYPDHFSVIVELAGVDVEKVEVGLNGRILTIHGHRQQLRPPGMSTIHLLEINYGDFERVLELPLDIDADGTRAVYRSGFLEIMLPKQKKQRSRSVHVHEKRTKAR